MESYINTLQDEEVDVLLRTNGTSLVYDNIAFDGTYSNFGPYVNLSVDFM